MIYVKEIFSKAQICTWPNLITFVRLLCIPVFLFLIFARDNNAGAAWLLAALGATDWVDGYIARKFDQASKFGAVFDPSVDRLLFVAAIPALLILGAVPYIYALLALLREGVVVFAAFYLWSKKVKPFSVTWSGKAGTFLLMFAFPLFLGADSTLSYAGFLGFCAPLFASSGLLFSFYSLIFEYFPRAKANLA